MGKKKKASAKKGKKPHKNKPTSKKHSHYKLGGGAVARTKKTCPRCGPGNFLAGHKNRSYCGKCHYTEFAEKTT